MKWEYLKTTLECSDRVLIKRLNKYGKQGWEVVAIEKMHPARAVYYVLFKRNKEMNPSER